MRSTYFAISFLRMESFERSATLLAQRKNYTNICYSYHFGRDYVIFTSCLSVNANDQAEALSVTKEFTVT